MMKKIIMLLFFLFQISFIFSQKIDSSKIYAYPYQTMSYIRVHSSAIIADSEQIVLDSNYTKRLYNDVIGYLKSKEIYIRNNENINQKGKLDYRLLIEFFICEKKEVFGFGSNGLMIYNNTLYPITKAELSSFFNNYKKIKNVLRL